MNSETSKEVAAICDRHPLSATNTEWFLRFQELADFANRLEIRNRRLVEALRNITENCRLLCADSMDFDDTSMEQARAVLIDQQEEKR